MKSKHELKKRFFCKSCKYGTYFKSNVEAHIKTKHRMKGNFGCDHCDKYFIKKSTLDNHTKRQHKVTVSEQKS
jgi:RNase P subunit RPR2